VENVAIKINTMEKKWTVNRHLSSNLKEHYQRQQVDIPLRDQQQTRFPCLSLACHTLIKPIDLALSFPSVGEYIKSEHNVTTVSASVF